MKITNIHKTIEGKHVRVSADIIFNDGRVEKPYFSVPKKFAEYLMDDASAFLAAFLIPCMQRRENIIVDGEVSRSFLKNVEKIIDMLVKWDIGLSRVDIAPKSIITYKLQPTLTAQFFSAGVDSFYTYLKNKKSKTQKITHFLFVHGFDIELQNTALYEQSLANIQQVAHDERVTLITIETNIKSLIEKDVLWDWGHGGALGAVALLLRKKIKTVYIAGSVSADTVFTYGTHPDLDPLWGSDVLQIIHDGTEYNRVDKITEIIGKSPLALRYLRVCAVNTKGTYNCGKCFKCLRTMIELLCVTDLDKAKTFPATIDLEKVRNMYYDYTLFYELEGYAVLHKLQAQKRLPELQKAVLYSLEKSRTPGLKRKIVGRLAQFDRRFNNRRMYRFIFHMNTNQDRSLLFKALLRTGVIK
jgi:hypothetical protein